MSSREEQMNTVRISTKKKKTLKSINRSHRAEDHSNLNKQTNKKTNREVQQQTKWINELEDRAVEITQSEEQK